MPKKIVIVEDEKFLQEMYKIKFEAEGYQIWTASDGVEALKVIADASPDLVLLDLVMPKLDGYSVLAALRKDEKTKDLKVYVLSNLGQTGEIDRGVKEGANGYFVKSNLTPTQLANEVKKII